ncbi:DUF7410 domain-containing protein [Halorussus litoreus]|uniref:DUF7410 domain-containing protein n=1 Tax=Halorussus litoreus TaxID=1710536 RepID=UPI000E257D7E|nr:hypothetical protein [Halorussus litoreus]
MSLAIPDTDFHVPDGETPVQCPHCGRPFRTERLRALHVGDAHDGWTDDEREAYESAMEAEREDLFVYHLKVVASLVAVYAFFFFTYLAVSMAQA